MGVLRFLLPALALMAMVSSEAGAQGKDSAVQLLKVIGAKDETVIGATKEDAERHGAANALEAIARELEKVSHMVVWQYAVRRTASGASEYAAFRRVALFKQGVLRIEPMTTDFEIQPPPK
ncbi:MAG: hypothetical protein EXQ87_06775 [Alphaproteobacteria bacterium]|nr:hypothetical protein [Alphaproteobacteria bacterium]